MPTYIEPFPLRFDSSFQPCHSVYESSTLYIPSGYLEIDIILQTDLYTPLCCLFGWFLASAWILSQHEPEIL